VVDFSGVAIVKTIAFSLVVLSAGVFSALAQQQPKPQAAPSRITEPLPAQKPQSSVSYQQITGETCSTEKSGCCAVVAISAQNHDQICQIFYYGTTAPSSLEFSLPANERSFYFRVQHEDTFHCVPKAEKSRLLEQVWWLENGLKVPCAR
jgi:hypothetical protein